MDSRTDVTVLLRALSSGERGAIDDLLPIVYAELKRLAQQQLRAERPDHTLNTTALVHEAYLKLVDHPPDVDWQGRGHFFAVACRAMRQVLVNYAKKRQTLKRGGGQPALPLDDNLALSSERADYLVALDEALDRLEEMDSRQSRIVECRYFGGLTIEETAKVLDISSATVKRDWMVARAWLYREVSGDQERRSGEVT